jgi:hypothetical protein
VVAHPEILWMLVQPKIKWRLYPFRGDEALPALHIHRSSSYLIGKEKKVSSHVLPLRIWSACSGLDLHLNAILTHQITLHAVRQVCDIFMAHPSISKQHAGTFALPRVLHSCVLSGG